MNDLTPHMKKMFEKARDVRLSSAEKESMHVALSEYMKTEATRPRLIPSPWAMGRLIVLVHKPVAVVLIAVLFLGSVGAGTAYAAEGALPGDALYPIKVDIVEEVRAAFTVSDQEKIRWDARRAERRLEEAAALAARGDLTEAKEKEIGQRFEKLAERVETRAQKVEDNGDANSAAIVLSEFEGTLRGHAQILAKADMASSSASVSVETSVEAASPLPLGEFADMDGSLEDLTPNALQSEPTIAARTLALEVKKEKVQTPEVHESKITIQVRQRLGKLERAREKAEQKVESKDGREKQAAESRIKDAEQALKRVEKALQDRPQRKDVKARVDSARERIQEAHKSGESGSSTEAFIEAQAAVRSIQESNVLLRVNDETVINEAAEGDVDINVNAESTDGRSKIEIKTNVIFNQNDD